MSRTLRADEIIDSAPRFQARAAGGLWLLCILTGIAGFLCSAPLIVANDAAATAANILANNSSFRVGFVLELISYAAYLGAALFVYYLLKPVSRSLSLLAAFFGLAGVTIGVVAWAGDLVPLVLLGGDRYLGAFTAAQLQAISLAAINLQMQILNVGLVFFGIHVASIGYLIARSTFLPRVLGIFLVLCGTSYVLSSLLSFVTPSVGAPLMRFAMFLALSGEGSLSVWLFVKGVHVKRWLEHVGAPAVPQPLRSGKLQPIVS